MSHSMKHCHSLAGSHKAHSHLGIHHPKISSHVASHHGGSHVSHHGGSHLGGFGHKKSHHGGFHMSHHGGSHMSHLGSSHMSHHGGSHMSHHGGSHISHHGDSHMSHHGGSHMSHLGSSNMTHHGGSHMSHHGGSHISHLGSSNMTHHGGSHMSHHGGSHMPHHGGSHMSHLGNSHMSHLGNSHTNHHGGSHMSHHRSSHMSHLGSSHMTHGGSHHTSHHGSHNLSHRGDHHMSHHGGHHMLHHGGHLNSHHGAHHASHHGGSNMSNHGGSHLSHHGGHHMSHHGGHHISNHGGSHVSKHGGHHMSHNVSHHGCHNTSHHGSSQKFHHGGQHKKEVSFSKYPSHGHENHFSSFGHHSGFKGDSLFNVNEKEIMQVLNERLSSYLSEVRSLEMENAQLERKICEWYENNAPKTPPDGTQYFRIVNGLQNQIMEAAMENANAMLEIDNARLAADDYRSKYELELMENKTAEMDVNNLARILEGLNGENSELEMLVQSLQEERICLKMNSEEEIESLLSQLGARINVELNAAPSIDLNEALSEIREEYENLMDRNLREAETMFLQMSDELSHEVASSSEKLQSVETELIEMKRCMQALEIELQSELSLKSAMEDTLVETEATFGSKLAELQCLINNLESEFATIRSNLERQNYEYKVLMDQKTHLEMEIATYKRLLDGHDIDISEHGMSNWKHGGHHNVSHHCLTYPSRRHHSSGDHHGGHHSSGYHRGGHYSSSHKMC